MNNNLPRTRFPRALIVIFIIYISVVFISNYLYFIRMKQENKIQLYDQLSAISRLKVDQILKWRSERMGEAFFIFNNPDFKKMAKDYFFSKSPVDKNAITEWLRSIKENHEYSEIFLGKEGNSCLPLFRGKESVLSSTDKELILHSFNSKEIIFSDFINDPQLQRFYLSISIPLINKEYNNGLPFGIVILKIDPSKILFPLIQSWPTPSKTAESILIRREGNKVAFLNEPRHKINSSGKLQLSINDLSLPAARAVKGMHGIFEGVDYRGIKVVSDLNRIPNTTWFIVSKIDASEIYRPINERAVWILLISGVLVIMGGLLVYLIWKQQQIYQIKKMLVLEKEKQALKSHFEYLVKYANDIIILFNEEFNLIEVNERAIKVYGYTKDEFLKLNINNLQNPESINNLLVHKQQENLSAGYIFETLHTSKNGDIFPVEVSSRSIIIEENKYYQYIIRDITERKNFEHKIVKLNRVYSIMSNINQAIVRISDKTKLLNEACQIAVEQGHLSMAWIGTIDNISKIVVPVCSYSYKRSYQDIINIALKSQDQGPIPDNLVIKNAGYIVCNDIENSNYNNVWMNEAARCGYKSTITLPLIIDGEVVGLFNLFSEEKDFFDGDEVKLLDELSMDISHAIDNFNKEERRKHIEEALKENEEKYRHLFELESDALFLIDNESGKILEVNSSACNLYGYTREEFLEMKNVDVSAQPEETRNATVSTLTKIPIRYHRKKDGTVFPVEISASRLIWQGRQVHMPAIRDISDRLKAENDLRESQQMLRIILDTIPVRVFWKDLHLNYSGCNLAFAKDAGFNSTEEIIGKNDFEMSWSENAKKYRDDDRSVIKSGLPKFNYEETKTLPYGKIIWLLTSKVPLYDSDGSIKGVLGVYEEITERRHFVEEIKNLNLELEKRVEERTQQLLTANTDLEAFSYSVSHDLRSPLRAIDGFTRIMVEEYMNKLDEVGQELLNNVIRNTEKMSQLIDDLLNFSRLGKKVLNCVEINMEDFFNEIYNEIKEKDRNIEFRLSKLPTAYADRNLLKQVVINLLSNALKFTRKNEHTIIEVSGKDNRNNDIFCVKDNGVGFDKKFSEKLFQVFQRLHSADDFEGTGVGLAIAQRIINKHGGRIWAVGETGVGATFYFNLPKENSLI
jgi:PAS domain S-box-containing protein